MKALQSKSADTVVGPTLKGVVLTLSLSVSSGANSVTLTTGTR